MLHTTHTTHDTHARLLHLHEQKRQRNPNAASWVSVITGLGKHSQVWTPAVAAHTFISQSHTTLTTRDTRDTRTHTHTHTRHTHTHTLQGGRAQIKPAVERHLRANNYQFREQGGVVFIRIR
jgi:hypothetical protein